MNTIQYENSLEQPITVQQKDSLDKYHKNYIENDLIKKKEYYSFGKIKHVIFYKENESLEDIFSLYPNVNTFEVRERENLGNFIKETERVYYEGINKIMGISVVDQQGRDIYTSNLNKDDETVIIKSVWKFFHGDYYGQPNCEHHFYYDEDGNLLRMVVKGDLFRADETANYFGDNWVNMGYYHNATPIIPQ